MSVSQTAQSQKTRLLALTLYRSLLRQVYHENDSFRRYRLQKQLRSEVDKLQEMPTEQLAKLAEEKLRFLRSVTPRVRVRSAPDHQNGGNRAEKEGEGDGKEDKTVNGRTLFVVRDGKVVNVQEQLAKQEKAISNWMEGNIDPEAYQRHQYLNRRMRFEEGPLQDYPSNVWGM